MPVVGTRYRFAVTLEKPCVLLVSGHIGIVEVDGIVSPAERAFFTGLVDMVAMNHIGEHLLERGDLSLLNQLFKTALGAGFRRGVINTFSSAEGKTVVPMSRPSITIPFSAP